MSDAKYLAWIRKQPSCISGNSDWFEKFGEGRCVAAHVRRAKDAGTGFKPHYSAVPLTDAEHRTQSTQGELACLKWHKGGEWTVETAKAWFDDQASHYRWKYQQENPLHFIPPGYGDEVFISGK